MNYSYQLKVIFSTKVDTFTPWRNCLQTQFNHFMVLAGTNCKGETSQWKSTNSSLVSWWPKWTSCKLISCRRSCSSRWTVGIWSPSGSLCKSQSFPKNVSYTSLKELRNTSWILFKFEVVTDIMLKRKSLFLIKTQYGTQQSVLTSVADKIWSNEALKSHYGILSHKPNQCF